MRHRRRARSPPGLTYEGDVDRAQKTRLAAEKRAARHANREQGQPARTNQAAADDANREDGQPARQQGGSGGPVAPSEQVHPRQQRQQSEATAGEKSSACKQKGRASLQTGRSLIKGEEAVRQRQFEEYLLRLGNSREPTIDDLGEDFIQLPEDMLCPRQKLESLTAAIYGNLQQHHADSQYLSERDIPTLNNYGGDACHLTSSVKEGAPIMLLRNMHGARGQANGTRLVVAGLFAECTPG
ncbi:MAG: hypothetical protein FRX49_08745 [Trebouxia sp. A1-2]|nr:MAG: hypothetical protein FRX49_08745 [Trebouxia sp. A1-2]